MATRKTVKKTKSVKKAAKKPAARAARRPASTAKTRTANAKSRTSTQVATAKVAKPVINIKLTDRAAAVESIMGESQSLHEFLSSSGW